MTVAVEMQEKCRKQTNKQKGGDKWNLHTVKVRKAMKREEPLTNTCGVSLSKPVILELQVYKKSSEKSGSVRFGNDHLFFSSHVG